MKGSRVADGIFWIQTRPAARMLAVAIKCGMGYGAGTSPKDVPSQNSSSTAGVLFSGPSELAHKLASSWASSDRRRRRGGLQLGIDILDRANQPLLKAKVHRNPMRLAAQAGLLARKNLVDELGGIAVQAGPSSNG